mmetsp:Transcript_33007/g.77842  ORF Transcript_33007/g.77842 Transcript_33007/m.77842 type:complete len:235 (+) Transcript_33007:1-705(+)
MPKWRGNKTVLRTMPRKNEKRLAEDGAISGWTPKILRKKFAMIAKGESTVMPKQVRMKKSYQITSCMYQTYGVSHGPPLCLGHRSQLGLYPSWHSSHVFMPKMKIMMAVRKTTNEAPRTRLLSIGLSKVYHFSVKVGSHGRMSGFAWSGKMKFGSTISAALGSLKLSGTEAPGRGSGARRLASISCPSEAITGGPALISSPSTFLPGRLMSTDTESLDGGTMALSGLCSNPAGC